MPCPTVYVGELRAWRIWKEDNCVEGFMYKHAYITDGTRVTLPVKHLVDYDTHWMLKTPFTEPGTAYRMAHEDELDFKEN